MSNDETKKSFWNNEIIWLIIGLLLILLLGAILVANNMSFANAISICASTVAILSLLFTQYKNSNNMKKQLDKADERLEIQMSKANARLEKQLNAQKENLKEQLIHDDKQKVLLNIYKELSNWQNSKKSLNYNLFRDNIHNAILKFASDGNMIKNEELSIFINKLYIYMYLKEIRSDIFSYYYIPDDIKKIITDYLEKIENETLKRSGTNKDDFIKILSSFIEKFKNDKQLEKIDIKLCALLNDVFYDEKLKINEDINNIYKKIEKEVGIKMVN